MASGRQDCPQHTIPKKNPDLAKRFIYFFCGHWRIQRLSGIHSALAMGLLNLLLADLVLLLLLLLPDCGDWDHIMLMNLTNGACFLSSPSALVPLWG